MLARASTTSHLPPDPRLKCANGDAITRRAAAAEERRQRSPARWVCSWPIGSRHRSLHVQAARLWTFLVISLATRDLVADGGAELLCGRRTTQVQGEEAAAAGEDRFDGVEDRGCGVMFAEVVEHH